MTKKLFFFTKFPDFSFKSLLLDEKIMIFSQEKHTTSSNKRPNKIFTYLKYFLTA